MVKEFDEGDRIIAHGNTYRIESKDIMPSGEVLQYRLDGLGGAPPATLRVNDDGFTIAEYWDADPKKLETNHPA
jgi:hypothetical protein